MIEHDRYYVPFDDMANLPDEPDPLKPGFTGDEEEDHRLDDPRTGQAAGLNRKYG